MRFKDVKLEYPAKVIIAWGEAIDGNAAIRDWLVKNGYPELGLFCFALYNKQDAREWLMANHHPHLMALIRGAEGDKSALSWLMKFGLTVLAMMARSGDNDDHAHDWLVVNGYRDLALIALRIRKVKNSIEAKNSDHYRISKD